jgi:hypothetical protein
MKCEPVVFLSFVENNLQRSHAQRQQRNADVINTDAGVLNLFQEGWILHQDHRQVDGERGDRQIN